MKQILYIIFPALFLLSSCGAGDKTDNGSAPEDSTIVKKDFNWPDGKYIYVNDGGMYLEEWSKGDSGMFKGKAFFIDQKTNDTLYSVVMKLQNKKDKTTLFYILKGKTENKDIEFLLSKEERNVFVFENPFRDFPSILQYKILGDSAIEVVQRGFVNNHEQVKEYKVKKID